MKIEGRTFVVSGGTSGLGQACVEDICRHGGNVSVLGRNEETGAAVVESISSQNGAGAGAAKFFVCNVLDTKSIAAAVAGTVEWIWQTGKPLGGVIPAAGVIHSTKILDREGNAFSLDTFASVFDVNVRGTIDLVRQCLVHLAESEPAGDDKERGVVIMVASCAAFDGQKCQVAYAASKGAVAAMTLPMTRDLARYGIRCLTIAPGVFESRMTAMLSNRVMNGLEAAMEFPRRAGNSEEFAQFVRQVIDNAMFNGTVVRLDGGLRLPSTT